MSLSKKLNLAPGASLRVVGKPSGVDLGDVAVSAKADAVLVFAKTRADVDGKAGPAFDAAKRDAIAWIAYPKAGQLGTDLSRDVLAAHVAEHGVQPVRQVAIDDVWSALRFRPKK